ncbi:hypothetical protein [Kitasatospora sp. NPDC008115]|uniref:hypothetical protein n=1 Tax=Kitasatospora sp. NPDC008115 TaxID=3364022 RepID=UPI0036EFA9D8
MKDDRMFDPDGGDPLHLPDQHDAVEGFAEFVGEVAEFVGNLVEDLAEAIDLIDEQADEAAPAEDDPDAADPAGSDEPMETEAAPVDPAAAVDPADFIHDILTADADRLAAMEEQLRGIAEQGDFGPHLPPDVPPHLPPDLRGPA